MDWWKDLIQKLNKFKHKLPTDLTSDTESVEESREMGAVKTLQRRVRMQALTAVASVAALLVLVWQGMRTHEPEALYVNQVARAKAEAEAAEEEKTNAEAQEEAAAEKVTAQEATENE